MSLFDTWLDTDSPPSSPTRRNSRTVLDQALAKLASAVASLHRAGSFHKHRSEAFWIFAAGSWSRSKYEEAVAEATKILPGSRSADSDVAFAERRIAEAIAILRKDDGRDADDLVDALWAYRDGDWHRSQDRRRKRSSVAGSDHVVQDELATEAEKMAEMVEIAEGEQ